MNPEESTKKSLLSGCFRALGALVFVALVLFIPRLYHFFEAKAANNPITRVRSNGHQLVMVVLLYATDNHGVLPHTLLDLVDKGMLKLMGLDDLLSHPLEKPQKPLGWIYLPDLTTDTVGDYPVLISPIFQDQSWAITQKLWDYMSWPSDYPIEPMRIVAFCDGSINDMSEPDFQTLLKKHNIVLPTTTMTTDTTGK